MEPFGDISENTAAHQLDPSEVVPGPLGGDELASLLEVDNAAARPSLVARPGRMSAAELRALPEVVPGALSPLAATLLEGTPESLDCVRDGRAGVQDEGSQLVALALTRASAGDGSWLDLCSGPGGKAAILGGVARERGGSLTCVEPHAHRARLVEQSVAGDARILVADARTRPWGDELFDRVLVDAPCTGIGALRRRPESRWRRTAARSAGSRGPCFPRRNGRCPARCDPRPARPPCPAWP